MVARSNEDGEEACMCVNVEKPRSSGNSKKSNSNRSSVPLKKITTEAVAEALLHIYSRVGIPEEVLADQGTQFMSKCMQEVSRLLSIRVSPVCHTTPFVTDWLRDGTEP